MNVKNLFLRSLFNAFFVLLFQFQLQNISLLLNLKKALYLILIIKLFKNSSNIAFIAKSIIILNRNIINSLIRVVKIIIILTIITIKKMTIIMITMIIIINSKIKRITIEKMINLIIKNVVIKIETLLNLLTIKKKS